MAAACLRLPYGCGMSSTIRLRTPDDRDSLVKALAEQQAASCYPFRWPLPMPVADFVFRASDESAWVACESGRVVGHVAVGVVDEDDELGRIFAPALEVPADTLRAVTTLFTSLGVRGQGMGRALLTTAETYIAESGRRAVLDVLPVHGQAFDMYIRRGWSEVAHNRPTWLPATAPDVHYLAR